MKGYKYLDEITSSKFINSYEKDDEKIILHMNNGDTLEYKYSDVAIAKAADKQKETFISYNEEELKTNLKVQRIHRILTTIFGGSTAVFLIILFLLESSLLWTLLACGSVGALVTQVCEQILTDKRIKELNKQRLYMGMKHYFDDEILDNPNISQCLTKSKVKEMYKQREKTGSTFNLTSIDSLSLEDLKKLKRNIEREDELGFKWIQPEENQKQYHI